MGGGCSPLAISCTCKCWTAPAVCSFLVAFSLPSLGIPICRKEASAKRAGRKEGKEKRKEKERTCNHRLVRVRTYFTTTSIVNIPHGSSTGTTSLREPPSSSDSAIRKDGPDYVLRTSRARRDRGTRELPSCGRPCDIGPSRQPQRQCLNYSVSEVEALADRLMNQLASPYWTLPFAGSRSRRNKWFKGSLASVFAQGYEYELQYQHHACPHASSCTLSPAPHDLPTCQRKHQNSKVAMSCRRGPFSLWYHYNTSHWHMIIPWPRGCRGLIDSNTRWV